MLRRWRNVTRTYPRRSLSQFSSLVRAVRGGFPCICTWDKGPVGVEGASPMEGEGEEAREEVRLPTSDPKGRQEEETSAGNPL